MTDEELLKELEKRAEAYNDRIKRDFAIEELEQIKNEIQGLIDFEESCCGNTTLGYECLSVINNKISELKGDNK